MNLIAQIPIVRRGIRVFVSEDCEYHLMMPSRGYDVIETFMGKCEAEVWVCDCWKPQLN